MYNDQTISFERIHPNVNKVYILRKGNNDVSTEAVILLCIKKLTNENSGH